MWNLKARLGLQTSFRRNGSVAGTQTNVDRMVRSKHALSGEWVPLDSDTVRRRAIIRCVRLASTSNSGTHNVTFAPAELAQIVNKDLDGDIRVVLLSDMETQ